MADNWYYVQKGNRQGPVSLEVITGMIASGELKAEDYVWKKGFENWKRVKEVPELEVKPAAPAMPAMPEMPEEPVSLSLNSFNPDERSVFIRIGADRGEASSDYGPFTIKQLKQLYDEKRINGKTFVFVRGMKDFQLLADFTDFQEFFEEAPPVIKEVDRRVGQRRPFVARMFVQNNKSVFEGICRDVSIGGMQVLMDQFTGKAGDSVSINVHPENTDYHFTASGTVVRILEGNSGFSFRFNALSDEARSSIEKYIQQN